MHYNHWVSSNDCNLVCRLRTIPHNIGDHSQIVEDIEMKENEVYGVSMETVRAGRPQMQDDALMSRNVCYVTTQHMEIVDNEC